MKLKKYLRKKESSMINPEKYRSAWQWLGRLEKLQLPFQAVSTALLYWQQPKRCMVRKCWH